MTVDGIKLAIRNRYICETSYLRRKCINKTEFTIISNNCWGGVIYESYGLPKQTPTVGMYFVADEYIKFVSDLKHYIEECQMTFIEPDKARHREFYSQDSKFGSFPIAMVGDVEIALLHAHSQSDAVAQWKRRCDRIQWKHLLVKMNDQNKCTREHMERFCALPLKNKIFFTVRENWNGIEGITYLKSKRKECCGLFDEPFGSSSKMNVNTVINQL